MKGIFKWFADNPLVLAMGFVGVLFIMVVISKDATIREVRAAGAAKDTQISALTRDNTTLKNNNASLTVSVATQNAALTEMNAKAGTMDARFDTVMAQLAASQSAITGKISTIRNVPAPADKCKGASDLIRSAIQ